MVVSVWIGKGVINEMLCFTLLRTGGNAHFHVSKGRQILKKRRSRSHFRQTVTTTPRTVAVKLYMELLSPTSCHLERHIARVTTTIPKTKMSPSTTTPLHRAPRNVLERRWASNLLVVNGPAIEVALGPVPPPVATRLQVLRELGAPGATLNTADSLSPVVVLSSAITAPDRHAPPG